LVDVFGTLARHFEGLERGSGTERRVSFTLKAWATDSPFANACALANPLVVSLEPALCEVVVRDPAFGKGAACPGDA
jgi:hypothetical protein